MTLPHLLTATAPGACETLILCVQSYFPDLAGLKLLLTWTHSCRIFTPLSMSGTWARPTLMAFPTSQWRVPPVDMEPFLLLASPQHINFLTSLSLVGLFEGRQEAGLVPFQGAGPQTAWPPRDLSGLLTTRS